MATMYFKPFVWSHLVFLSVILLAILTGCDPQPDMARTASLPAARPLTGDTLELGDCPSTVPSRPAPIQLAEGLEYSHGGIIRGPRDRKRIALVFTGGSFGEGFAGILDDLAERQAKASFFFTGEFISIPEHRPLIRRALAEGHYLGPHSDAHLLYCPWDDRERTLVGLEEFRADLQKNLADLIELGACRDEMRFFVPPFEWYNEEIAEWTTRMGLVLVSFTPGTRSNADYLPDSAPRFISSERILASILDHEAQAADGLNGFLLLLHVGAGPQRTDKMHRLVGPLLDALGRRGYQFTRVDDLLGSCQHSRSAHCAPD